VLGALCVVVKWHGYILRMSEPTVPSVETEIEEVVDAHVHAGADAEPTPEEEAAADSNTPDPAVAAAEKAFNEIGANVKGEGKLP
jgi:hypothetical protein